MTAQIEDVLTAEEVANKLKIPVGSVNELARKNRIPCVWVSPKVRRFIWADVAAAIKKRNAFAG